MTKRCSGGEDRSSKFTDPHTNCSNGHAAFQRAAAYPIATLGGSPIAVVAETSTTCDEANARMQQRISRIRGCRNHFVQQTCMISLAQGGCKIGSSRRMSPQRLRRIAYRRRSPICRQWSTFRCMFVRAIFLKSKHHLLFIFRKNFTTKLQRNPALEFLPEKEIHAGSGGRGPEHTAVNTSQTHTVTW